MSHRRKCPECQDSNHQHADNEEKTFDGWIPTLIACIAVIGMFLSVVALLLGATD